MSDQQQYVNDPWGLGKQPQETAEQREFIQANWPAPPQPRKRLHWAWLIVGLLVIALGAVTATAITQHANAVEATALASTNAQERDDANVELDDTKDELDSTQSALDGAEATLSICEVAIEASEHNNDALFPLADAAGSSNIYTRISKMGDATDELKKTKEVLDREGFDDIYELYDSCASEGSSS